MSAIQSQRVCRSFHADRQRLICRRRVLAGRDAAPSGEPMRQGRLGGRGNPAGHCRWHSQYFSRFTIQQVMTIF